MTYYVKKVEGVRQDSQAEDLEKMIKLLGKFQGSYSIGSRRTTFAAKPIMSGVTASIRNYSGTPSHNF